MAKFQESRWADTDFSQRYITDADSFLPFRRQFLEAAKSLFAHFISTGAEARILDLGCGDGLFLQELLRDFSPAGATLVDGSPEMLAAARERLKGKSNLHFVHSSFQNLLLDDPLQKGFDFIFSSLAIHHIPLEEKKKLYTYIFDHLLPRGFFVHYDVVLAPTEQLEKWYLSLWREWISCQSGRDNREKLVEIPDQYKSNSDNIPDTLESQLEALKDIGFSNVDCFLKNGIFTLFGGSR